MHSTRERFTFAPVTIAVLFSLLCLVAPQRARAKLLFDGNFETGNTSQYGPELCCGYSATMSTSTVREGRYAVRFELRKSDPDVASSKRAELKPPGTTSAPVTGGVGDERWFGFSVFIPSDWVDDTLTEEEIVFQVHEYPDDLAGGCDVWRSPPLSLHVKGGNFVVQKRADSRKCMNDNNPAILKDFPAVPMSKGRWNDFVVHVKWSYLNDGILEVWKDGVQIVDDAGPNYYNDATKGFAKIGLYKWGWKQNPAASIVSTRVLYHDAVKVGDQTSSYAEVAPTNTSLPPTPSTSPSPAPTAAPAPSPTPVSGAVFADSSPQWQNKSLTAQSNLFSVEFDAVPLGQGIDAVTALSSQALSSYAGAAISVRFNPNGIIDVRSGGQYMADASIQYAANQRYHVKIDGDVRLSAYTVTVTPPGGVPTVIARNYGFRTEQVGAASIGNIGVIAPSGSHRLFNLSVKNTSAPQSFRLEAESAQLTSPMSVRSSSTASGGRYIATTTRDRGQAVFTINSPVAASYTLKVRVYSPNTARDSFYIQVNGGTTEDWAFPVSSSWQTVIYSKAVNLRAGSNTVVIKGREAETYLDLLELTPR